MFFKTRLRRFLLLFLVILLIILGLVFKSFLPEKLNIQNISKQNLPEAMPPTSMKISALPTGTMESEALFAYRGGELGKKIQFGMTAVLIQHPKGDVLIDTGFGSQVKQHAQTMPWLGRTLATYQGTTPAAAQLIAQNYDPKKLKGALITHAHWDHVSGLGDLPEVTAYFAKAESDFIAHGDGAALMRQLKKQPREFYEFAAKPYLGYPQSLDFYGDGSIVIVPAGGHTPGSVVIFVTLPSGKRFGFVGDTVWQSEGINLPAEKPYLSRLTIQENAEAVRGQISHLAGLHQAYPEIQFLPAHDVNAFAKLPVFPETMQ